MNENKVIHRSDVGLISNDLSVCVSTMLQQGGVIVSPTKVGYIIMTTDRAGLEKKFMLKGRPKKKPGVVLLSTLAQLDELAEVDKKTMELYRNCWEKNILLGCILPWKEEAKKKYIPDDGSVDFVTDDRNTSCFVIKYGTPSEVIATKLWFDHKMLSFASSANPSGQGNRGQIEGVGEKILNGVDLIIEADEFVRKQQPDKDIDTRYEQGVMVSMVDENGQLVKTPTIIRNGLDIDRIKEQLSLVYGTFHHEHGSYH